MSIKKITETWYGKKPKRERKGIPKHVKESVWGKYIGMDKAEGKCYVCDKTIHITDFEVGHNRAISKGGSDYLSNLRPICRSCNLSMGTMSIESYKKKFYTKPKKKVSKIKKRKKRKERSPFDIKIPTLKI